MNLKTMLTDKTLSYLQYGSHVGSAEISAYIRSVRDCGADYIELTRKTAVMLPDRDFSENFILRIAESRDIGFAAERSFAYVVVPLHLAGYIEKLPAGQQVILDVPADRYSALAMLMYVRHFSFISGISMIRLTGVFCDFGSEFAELIKWYRTHFFAPLDICPLNTMMTGISDGLTAHSCGADMVTLSFGRGYYYTALEQFIIRKHINARKPMSQETVRGICAASLVFSSMFGVIPAGLERILDTQNDVCSVICDIEKGVTYMPVKPAQRLRKEKTDGVLEKKVRSIGLEREIEDAIIDTLKKLDLSFCMDKIKRNIIG